MTLSYKILLDPEEDAWNWYDGCNYSIQHGVNWQERVPEYVVSKVKGKSEKEAFEFILSFLKTKKYIEDKKAIDKFIKFINKRFSENFEKACMSLEKIMNRPIYRDNFTIYITTIPMASYNYEKGSIYDYIGWDDPISGFLHEVSHMQFYHYWRKDPSSEVAKLTEDQYEWLKESLTVILDKAMLPLIEKVDEGYEIHQPFRRKLHKFWKETQDFDKLVDYGVDVLPKFIQ